LAKIQATCPCSVKDFPLNFQEVKIRGRHRAIRMLLSKIRKFLKDESAGALTLTAVLMPMILGFAGMGLDATGWYMHKRSVQNLVDMAAIEAVHSGGYLADQALVSQVNNFLSDRGLDSSRDTLTLSSPPSAGDYVGRSGFTEIILRREVPLNFVNAFYAVTGEEAAVFVSSRAVAGTLIVGTQCIVALDETANRALSFSGNTEVSAGCGVASNSTSTEAIYLGGTAELTAALAMAVGDIEVGGGATLTTESPPQSYSQSINNPYDSLDIPSAGTCDYTGTTRARDDDILSPGRYCGDINVQGQNVVFDPGTYIIDGGDFGSNANAEFSGEGVTFILTGSTAADVGTVNMNGNTTAELSAPTSGDYQGILFFQDPIAEYRDTTALFNGGSNLLLDGVLYFPSGDISFNGGASADPSCLQIFGATVSFNGNSNIGNDETICDALDIDATTQFRVQLVE